MKLSLPMKRALLQMVPGRTYPNAAEVPAAWLTVEALIDRGEVQWVEAHLQFRLTAHGEILHDQLRQQWGDSEP